MVGGAARALLQRGKYDHIVLEFDYIAGRLPSVEAQNLLAQRIHEVTDKPVLFAGADEISTGQAKWSIDQILDLSRSRDMRSKGSTVALWIVYLDGESEEQPAALGVAASSTVIAIFADRIARFAQTLPPVQIEMPTLIHELGHILGLVNLVYDSPRAHADPSYPEHSNNPASVMYHSYELSLDILSDPEKVRPTTFDDDDLADLRDMSDGKL